MEVTPHWFANNTRFWYENELPGGAREIIVVDAQTGARERVEKPPSEDQGLIAELETHASGRDGGETKISFENRRSQTIELFWIDFEGDKSSYGTLAPGAPPEVPRGLLLAGSITRPPRTIRS